MPFVPDKPRFVPDQPSEIPQRTGMETAGRMAGIVAGRLAPYATAAAAGGAVAGPLGVAAGPVALGLSDLAAAGINVGAEALGSELRVPAPSDVIRSGFQAVAPSAFPTPETTGERLLATGAEAGTAALSQANALRQLASTLQPSQLQNVLTELGKAPKVQTAAAVPAAIASDVTAELADENEIMTNPYGRAMLGTVAGLLGGAAGAKAAGIGAVKAPSAEGMRQQAKAKYQAVDQSGITFEPAAWNAWLGDIRGKLKSFDPAQHGSVELEIKNLEKSMGQARTIGELDTARSNIKKRLGKSTDPNIRRLGAELTDELDDFVMNSPPAFTATQAQGSLSGITSPMVTPQTAGQLRGLDEARAALQEARNLYAAVSKSDAMEEMVRRAKLSSLPLDTAIRTEFRNFAKNPRKMRLLTPEERGFVEDVVLNGKLASALTNVSQALRISRTFGGGLYASAGAAGIFAPNLTPTQQLGYATTILGARALTGAGGNVLARRRAAQAAALMRGARPGAPQMPPIAAGTAAGLAAVTPEELDFMREQQRINNLGF
jgi:hypothetical protein